jgi:PadR family transcriptional regulator, regulatory protein PadR
MGDPDPIPPGTLDMLVLRTVVRAGKLHGFEIAEAIEQISEDVFRVEEGSLYPALQRLLIKGWLVGEWGRTGENRKARFYQLTSAGRKQLEKELTRYLRVNAAIQRILEST